MTAALSGIVGNVSVGYWEKSVFYTGIIQSFIIAYESVFTATTLTVKHLHNCSPLLVSLLSLHILLSLVFFSSLSPFSLTSLSPLMAAHRETSNTDSLREMFFSLCLCFYIVLYNVWMC